MCLRWLVAQEHATRPHHLFKPHPCKYGSVSLTTDCYLDLWWTPDAVPGAGQEAGDSRATQSLRRGPQGQADGSVAGVGSTLETSLQGSRPVDDHRVLIVTECGLALGSLLAASSQGPYQPLPQSGLGVLERQQS